MARGINKVILIGNLGSEPELRYMPSGGAVVNVSLATSETWKDKETGQPQEKTEWHRLAFFGRLAEIAGEYLHKGSKIYVEGRLQTRKWQDQNGQDRYTTEVICNEMQMLDRAGDHHGHSSAVPQQDDHHQTPPTATARSSQKQSTAAAADDFDDDIPF